jgi:enoyl-CoA hydratase/carnithine racemase
VTPSKADPSSNGVGSETWAWTQLRIDRRSRGSCRVTFDNPPMNTVTATMVAELSELVGLIEEDPDLNVVVFDSANPRFFLADGVAEDELFGLDAPPAGMPSWTDLLARLSRAPVLSIASIRGRARGAGSEFALACDLRFASRENTLLGRFDIGTGAVSAAGPLARLSRLVGRGRALEILLVPNDLDGPRAEQYGYVNRLIDDDRLDAEVEEIASRLAGVEHEALVRVKSSIDGLTLPAESKPAPAA